MSKKYYVLVVLAISLQEFLEDLHGYMLYSCVCLCNCLYVVTEIKFNSIKFKKNLLVLTQHVQQLIVYLFLDHVVFLVKKNNANLPTRYFW